MKAIWTVRSALVWVLAALWSVFWITIAMVVSVFSSETALAMARLIWVRPVLWMVGVRLQLEPMPDLDWKRPYLFAMNHQSTLDIPVVVAALPVQPRFVSKQSMARVPFFGWYMRRTGMVFVDRSNRTRAIESLRLAGERIRAGASIFIFPEGTRSHERKILPFKKGPFALALEAGVPIVPVVIEGTGEALPANAWTARPGTVRVKVGRPISTGGRSPEEREALAAEVRKEMIRLHREIGGRGGDEDAAMAVETPISSAAAVGANGRPLPVA
jgi:1-acyl-sn-glycerol-3-phosphate acyltransferase